MKHQQGFQESKVKRVQTRQYRFETGQLCSLELHVFQNNEMALRVKLRPFTFFKEKADICVKTK